MPCRWRSYSARICFQSTRLRPAGSFGWLSAVGAAWRRIGLSPLRLVKDPESAAGKRVQAAVKVKKAIPQNGKKDNLSSEGKREEAERGRGQASWWRVLRDMADLGPRVPDGGRIAKALSLTRQMFFSVSCFFPAPAREVRRRLCGSPDCRRMAFSGRVWWGEIRLAAG